MCLCVCVCICALWFHTHTHTHTTSRHFEGSIKALLRHLALVFRKGLWAKAFPHSNPALLSCIHTCIYSYFTLIYIHIHMLYSCVLTPKCIYICMYVYIYILYSCALLHALLLLYLNVYTHTHTHTHTHTDTLTHAHKHIDMLYSCMLIIKYLCIFSFTCAVLLLHLSWYM
jgi:hypothetical protein